ncbi:MAG: transcriptional regulator [Salinarimonadaceae bacterium]|nr:MAG: transcriptional regulator [Salinarimonadaceae bacterium]
MALADPEKLIATLRSHEAEAEWFEFKKDTFNPEDVGQYISALANSAMLEDKRHSYLIFGITNNGHDIIGTNVRVRTEKIGGELFEHWITRFLSPKINLAFESCTIDGKRIEIICIEPAYDRPVKFRNIAYVRIQSIKKRLEEFPERERTLWNLTSRYSFEDGIAASHLSKEEIFARFHCKRFAAAIYGPNMSDENILYSLVADGMLIDNLQGGYDISNLFAIAAARNLHEFRTISHKAPRIITYKGNDRLHGIDDEIGQTGYVITFPKLLDIVLDKISGKEIFVHGIRKRERFYPEEAVREFIANALIHQDLTAVGSRPTIEIFKDKIEITNPGETLIDPDRLIDAPAKSRNEKLADLMRRAGLCEQRGSGIDRALWAIEAAVQAPPLFQRVEGSTVVTMFRATEFGAMSKEDRVRACYQHASLRKLRNDPMSNSTLRTRLGLAKTQSSQASNVIGDTIDAGLIKPLDPNQGHRVARYLPYWA